MEFLDKYEVVIGLEVHVELSTKSKIFCGCSTKFGAAPNTQTCPVCLGHPGVLPVLNKEAVVYAMRAAMAINCEISSFSKFDRKNYFYPDSPKAYQISQFDHPIGHNGWLDIELEGNSKRIGITRLHLEEDAGKLTHLENGKGSLVDFNRCGVPLVEIVSEPDMRSAAEAKAYLDKLRTIILYTGVSDAKLEEGSLRCDANISLRLRGESEFGTKTEVKNLNSFRNVERALLFEAKRQAELLESGQPVMQESRRWLEGEERTIMMRSKEEAHDYRYFPEPDLVPFCLDASWQEEIRSTLPELPDAKARRYQEDLGLSDYDTQLLVGSPDFAGFFEEALSCEKIKEPKLLVNWITGPMFAALKQEGLEIRQLKVTPARLAKLVLLLIEEKISSKIAKQVFATMLETGAAPEEIIEQQGLVQVSDEGVLDSEINKAIDSNPQSVVDFHNGKDRALGFIVGQVMKATRGKADPKVLNKLVRVQLERRVPSG